VDKLNSVGTGGPALTRAAGVQSTHYTEADTSQHSSVHPLDRGYHGIYAA